MTGSFMQIGDGPPIPVTNISWTTPVPPAVPDSTRPAMLQEFSVMIPIPTENAVSLLRAVGLPAEADRFEVAAHPDLAELNAQFDGFYGEGWRP